MAKQVYLDRRNAMVQWFRWMEIHKILTKEASKENPRSLEEIIQELQRDWQAGFNQSIANYKKKPKFQTLRKI